VDRQLKQDRIDIEASAGARLDILVENSGRINSTKMMRGETKEITHAVHLGDALLTGWQICPLPMDAAGTMRSGKESAAVSGPHFAFAEFSLKEPGDTFLDVSSLGKGALWINGHALGRFWNIGPQKTLYLPGPWLRKGKNEIVVFDLFTAPATTQSLSGLRTPILASEVPINAAARPGAL